MTAERYTTKSGATQFRPVLTDAEYRSLTYDGSPGFCLACGTECDAVEPDARQYPCDGCGARKVYGLEELLMMGLLKITEGAIR